MKLTFDTFHQAFRKLIPAKPLPNIVIGFSGGLDSTVALHLCYQLRQRGLIQSLRSVHVHHGMSSYADDWVEHIESLCRDWDVPCSVGYVSFSSRSNVEEGAREARYRVFEEELQAGEYLVQAHHRDDQVETQLYRMMRGTGVTGLKGIPVSRKLGVGILLRPLLGFERADIEEYARLHGLRWIEDESNTDTRYDRNFLRHQIVPLLNQRWPGMKESFSRLADICLETEELLSDISTADMASCMVAKVLPVVGEYHLLSIPSLQLLPVARQHLLLRTWMQQQQVYVPGKAMLQRVLNEVADARTDGEPVIHWEGGQIRRYREYLVAVEKSSHPETLSNINFNYQKEIILPGNGSINCSLVTDKGVSKSLLKDGVSGQFSLRADVQVQSFALPGRKGRKSLKKWLNEMNVPAWIRNQLPILHNHDVLIAIPGLLVAEGYQSEANCSGFKLEWIHSN